VQLKTDLRHGFCGRCAASFTRKPIPARADGPSSRPRSRQQSARRPATGSCCVCTGHDNEHQRRLEQAAGSSSPFPRRSRVDLRSFRKSQGAVGEETTEVKPTPESPAFRATRVMNCTLRPASPQTWQSRGTSASGNLSTKRAPLRCISRRRLPLMSPGGSVCWRLHLQSFGRESRDDSCNEPSDCGIQGGLRRRRGRSRAAGPPPGANEDSSRPTRRCSRRAARALPSSSRASR